MIRSDIKLKELSETLNNNDQLLIAEKVEELRQEKPFEGAIGLLAAYFDRSDDQIIRKSIAGFLNDLKDQSASAEVIKEIRKPWKRDTISMLISSCWQSGLNYSEYSLDLAKVFMTSDYVTAIECLTVIEESVDDLSRERKDEVIKFIEDSSAKLTNEIRALKDELLLILER
jgi:hypothetical protein